jgi:hypothetical protein
MYEYTMQGVKLGTTEKERDILVTVKRNVKTSAHWSKASSVSSGETFVFVTDSHL